MLARRHTRLSRRDDLSLWPALSVLRTSTTNPPPTYADLEQSLQDSGGEANVLQVQGQLFLGAGATDQGMDLLGAARSLYVVIGSRVGVVNCGILLARYEANRGEFAAAIEYLQPAADFGIEIGHPLGTQLQAQIDTWRGQLRARSSA